MIERPVVTAEEIAARVVRVVPAADDAVYSSIEDVALRIGQVVVELLDERWRLRTLGAERPVLEPAELSFFPILVQPDGVATLQATDRFGRPFRVEQIVLEDFVEPDLWQIEDISVGRSRQLAVDSVPATLFASDNDGGPIPIPLETAQSMQYLSLKVRNVSDRPAVFGCRCKGVAFGPPAGRFGFHLTTECGCEGSRAVIAAMEVGATYPVQPTCHRCNLPLRVIAIRMMTELVKR